MLNKRKKFALAVMCCMCVGELLGSESTNASADAASAKTATKKPGIFSRGFGAAVRVGSAGITKAFGVSRGTLGFRKSTSGTIPYSTTADDDSARQDPEFKEFYKSTNNKGIAILKFGINKKLFEVDGYQLEKKADQDTGYLVHIGGKYEIFASARTGTPPSFILKAEDGTPYLALITNTKPTNPAGYFIDLPGTKGKSSGVYVRFYSLAGGLEGSLQNGNTTTKFVMKKYDSSRYTVVQPEKTDGTVLSEPLELTKVT